MRQRSIPQLFRNGAPATDDSLLARFIATGDETAFELIVRRHAILVAGVCGRILRDSHLAEDATQATFLILARKADSVRGTNLAGWLFRVARRVSMRARRSAVRQREREAPLAVDPPGPVAPHPAERAELMALLDDEVARLPERFRLPVLLCYLGGATTDDAARTLDCPRGTVLSRLATARELLAVRLARRGFVLPLGVVFTDLVLPSTTAVACFVPATVRRAIAFRAGIVTDAPAAQLLAQGVLGSMKTTKLFAAAGVLFATIGLAGGLGWSRVEAGGEEPVALAAPPAQPEKAKPPAKEAEEAIQAERLRLALEMDRLGILIEKLLGEIAAKERAMQLMLPETEGPTPAGLDNELARLDSEIAKSRLEVQEAEVRLALLKKKLAAGLPPPPASEINALTDSDHRVKVLTASANEAKREAERTANSGGGETPLHRDLRELQKARDNELTKLRLAVRDELIVALRKIAETQFKNRIAENEDELEAKTAVLAARVKLRDEFAKSAVAARKAEATRRALERELEPQREALNRLIAARVQLTIDGRDVSPSTTDQKLDAVLKELRELRSEVKQLRERK